jgi:hypothetical protein
VSAAPSGAGSPTDTLSWNARAGHVHRTGTGNIHGDNRPSDAGRIGTPVAGVVDQGSRAVDQLLLLLWRVFFAGRVALQGSGGFVQGRDDLFHGPCYIGSIVAGDRVAYPGEHLSAIA